MYIPLSNFAGATDNQFVYLYSQFGTNFASNDGFEEWAVQSATQIVPLPLGSIAGGLGLLTVAAIRRRARR
jgi:hypothetical protein